MRITFLLLSFASAQASSQSPSLEHHQVSELAATYFEYRNCFLNSSCHNRKGKRVTEVPPWMIGGAQKTYFFVDGRQTNLWLTPKSLATNSTIDLKNQAGGPYTATQPYLMQPFFVPGIKLFDWKRNYHAIYSAHLIEHSTAGPVVLGFCHGENKNEVSGNCATGRPIQNTIQLNVPVNCADPQSFSGGKPYRDGWNAYNGIVSAVWTPDNHGGDFFSHELGPIAWPATGYVTTDGIKCTSGLRHPSSIPRNDSIYVFYVDAGPFGSNIPLEEGRAGGIKVLRVHKNEALDAKNYTVYYKAPDGQASWHPSLPEGFTKETMLDYVAVKGPKSTDVLHDSGYYWQHIRFSVARIRNSDYYMGVEQYIDHYDIGDNNQPRFKVALRLSRDLLHWSERQMILYSADSWEQSRLNYPVFLSKEGNSNTEIDLDEFLVVGSEHTPEDHVNKLRILSTVRSSTGSQGRAPFLFNNSLPAEPELVVFPNPFTHTMTVRMEVPFQSRVQIRLIGIDGRVIRKLEETIASYRYRASYDLSFCPPGLFLLQICVNNRVVSKKLVKQ